MYQLRVKQVWAENATTKRQQWPEEERGQLKIRGLFVEKDGTEAGKRKKWAKLG